MVGLDYNRALRAGRAPPGEWIHRNYPGPCFNTTYGKCG